MYEMDVAVGQVKTIKLPETAQSRSCVRPSRLSCMNWPAMTLCSFSGWTPMRRAARQSSIEWKPAEDKLNYVNDLPVAEPKVVLGAGETVHFNPLMNDHAAGWRGVYKTEPVIGVKPPAKGKMVRTIFRRIPGQRAQGVAAGYPDCVHRSPVMQNGRCRNEPVRCLASRQNRARMARGRSSTRSRMHWASEQRSNHADHLRRWSRYRPTQLRPGLGAEQ